MKACDLQSFCVRLLRYEESITLTLHRGNKIITVIIDSGNKKTIDWDDMLRTLTWNELKTKVLFQLIVHQVYPRCGLCGQPMRDYEKLSEDHIVCHCNNGHNELYNVQPACEDCNSKRSDKKPGNASPYLNGNNSRVLVSDQQIRDGRYRKQRNIQRFRGPNALEKMYEELNSRGCY